jgi:hypothetical protein
LSGDRYNTGKRKWGLLSFKALEPLVKVLEFGASKYAPYNWAKGLSFTETFECLQRHVIAWYNGEDNDPETGHSHMAHVLCNAMFLMHFIVTGTGTDDRPQLQDNNNKNKEVKIEHRHASNQTSVTIPGLPGTNCYLCRNYPHTLVNSGLSYDEANVRPENVG